MKKQILIFCLTICTTSLLAQSSSILMKVGDDIVSKHEFVSAYKKNYPDGVFSKKRVRNFVSQYALYKMKCIEAKQLLDSTNDASFLKNNTEEAKSISLYKQNKALQEKAHLLYNKVKQEVQTKGGMRKGIELFISLPQTATKAQEKKTSEAVKQLFNNITNIKQLRDYTPENTLQNNIKVEKRNIEWTTKGEALPEVENILFSLNPQERSKPFLAVDGWHIIEIEEAKEFPLYSEIEKQLLNHILQTTIREQIDKNIASTHTVNAENNTTENRQEINSTEKGNETFISKKKRNNLLNTEMQVISLQNKVIQKEIDSNQEAIFLFWKRYKKDIVGKRNSHQAITENEKELLNAAYSNHLVKEWEKKLQKKYALVIDKKAIKEIK